MKWKTTDIWKTSIYSSCDYTLTLTWALIKTTCHQPNSEENVHQRHWKILILTRTYIKCTRIISTHHRPSTFMCSAIIAYIVPISLKIRNNFWKKKTTIILAGSNWSQQNASWTYIIAGHHIINPWLKLFSVKCWIVSIKLPLTAGTGEAQAY